MPVVTNSSAPASIARCATSCKSRRRASDPGRRNRANIRARGSSQSGSRRSVCRPEPSAGCRADPRDRRRTNIRSVRRHETHCRRAKEWRAVCRKRSAASRTRPPPDAAYFLPGRRPLDRRAAGSSPGRPGVSSFAGSALVSGRYVDANETMPTRAFGESRYPAARARPRLLPTPAYAMPARSRYRLVSSIPSTPQSNA